MSKADGTILFDTKIDEAGFEASLKNLGKLAAAGTAAAATAISVLGKNAIEAYSNYEQLVGGVETLFGAGGKSLEEYAKSVGETTADAKAEYEKLLKSQETVIENASAAYKTAGMSANQYMETVTSFSASLLQSVGGDTIKAAKLSDQAIVDMSDNANKMGTSINSIQDAYKGFAKQQYNMLDNLKLGYGGTQQEMYRLLQDATKLDSKFAETAKFSMDSTGHLTVGFNDVVQAIHIVQDEMGITGTTAKEASSTIQGSVNMMKSSYENLLTGLADENADLGKLLDELVDSAFIVLDNVMPKVETFLDSVATAAAEYAPSIVTELVNALVSNLEPLIDAAFAMISSLVDAITNEENLKLIVESAVDIALKIADGLANGIDDIVDAAFTIIETLANSLLKEGNLSKIINAAFELVFSLVDALLEDNNLAMLIDAAIQLVTQFYLGLLDHIPDLIDAGLQLVVGLAKGIWDNRDELWQAIKDIGAGLVDSIANIGSTLADSFKDLFKFDASDELEESVKKAYEGFEQQNFSMLDELKLGYGSSREEMERLLADAEKLSGIKYDIGNIDDIKNAIHVIETEMDTASTNVQESTKESWEETSTWFSDNVTDPIDSFFSDLWQGIQDFGSTCAEGLEEAWNSVTESVTQLWDDVKNIFSNVVSWLHDTIVEPIINSTLFKVITELATGVWETIKIVWNVVSTWFKDNVVTPVKEFFTKLWNDVKELASKAWDGIVNIWNVVSSWFEDNIIVPVRDFFTELWTKISDLASEAWDTIVGVWETVSGWFNDNIISPIRDFFSDMWDSVKSKASDAWDGIKEVFGGVADWFHDKFAEAWQRVKDVFSAGGKVFDGIKEGITAAFKTVVNALIGGINKVIAIPFNAINNTLDKIRNVSIAGMHPFSGLITRFNVPQIPKLATGGVLNKATLAMLGENGAEAVVPLEKNTGWLNKIADRLNSLLTDDIVDVISRLIGVFETFVEKLPNLQNGADVVRYMTDVVKEGYTATSSIITASGSADIMRNGPSGGGKTEPQKPVYVENHIEFDGKKTAKVLTPYVEKELEWRDK